MALTVVVLQLGLPVLAYARMAQENGLIQEICSPQGVEKIVMATDGSVQEVARASAYGEHCQFSSTAGTPPVATLIQLHESARSPGAGRVD